MSVLPLIVALCLLILWLVAEFKWNPFIRIFLGLSVVIASASITGVFMTVIPNATIDGQVASILTTGKLLKAGKVEAAHHHIDVFESSIEHGDQKTIYMESMKLFQNLFKELPNDNSHSEDIEHAPPAGRGEAPRP